MLVRLRSRAVEAAVDACVILVGLGDSYGHRIHGQSFRKGGKFSLTSCVICDHNIMWSAQHSQGGWAKKIAGPNPGDGREPR